MIKKQNKTKQNILATLMIFLNQLKTFMKNFNQETTSKTAISKFLINITNGKKITNKEFHLYEAEIFLKP